MARVTKFQFALKSEKDKSKPSLLYVMFTLDKRYKISLQESVLPQWWDKELQRAIVIESGQQKQVDTRNAKRLNKYLEYVTTQLTNLFEIHKDWRKVRPNILGGNISSSIVRQVRDVINRYHKKEEEEVTKQNLTPSQYFEDYIAKLPTHTIKRTGTVMKPQTITNHHIVLKRYKRFLSHTHLIDSIELFNKRFEERMES